MPKLNHANKKEKACCKLAREDRESAGEVLRGGNEFAPTWGYNQSRAIAAESHLRYCAANSKGRDRKRKRR